MNAASPFQNSSFDPAWRRVLTRLFRVVEWLLWLAFFFVAIAFVLLRYAVLPNIDMYRPTIETALSRGVGAKVTIGHVEAGWDGLYPDLDLTDVRLFDNQGRQALLLPFVSLTVSWWSVPARELRLHVLEIMGADLDIRRTVAGAIVIGGIELAAKPDGGGLSDWILGQRRIVVAESRMRWNDDLRGARELVLSNIRTVLENAGSRHRFGFAADPPRELSSRVDVRADLRGDSLNQLSQWRGEIYADLNYIDLAAWREWMDYPFDVRSGTGSVRAWLGFDGDRLEHFTADVGLENAQARLDPNLQMMELARVSGRVGLREIASGGKALGFLRLGEKKVTGFEVSGRQVSLTTRTGISLAPADFSMKTVSARANKPQEVEMEANSLDLEPLAKLLEHLPLDAQFRKMLAEFNPRGSIFDFRLSWRGEFDRPAAYNLRGRFAELSVDARGLIPGVTNLSGAVTGNEKGGTLTLASRNSVILLPQIFEDPKLELDSVAAQLAWSFLNNRVEIRTDNAVFSNKDAAGTAQLLYRSEPDTPGHVELNARLTRGVGARAQRYLPKHLEVTRAWLQTAIEKGSVDEAVFHLKGNLRDFPFVDPKRGAFKVALKLSDTNLLYASGWPRIENARGELVFERNSMEFRSNAAGMIGLARLGRVDIRIAGLGARPHMLEISGTAEGPTEGFLKFIDQSPVDRLIDGFTHGMRSDGVGKLNLKISLPIEEIDKTRVAGQFQFVDNEMRLDADLPLLGNVNGILSFTESGMALRGLRGEALGGAFSLSGASRGDGSIGVAATGNFTVPGLRAWFDDPLLAAATGGSNWRATIDVRKNSGAVTVDSTLVGVAIDLPAPLGKPAVEPVPLKVVKSLVAGARNEEEFNVTLGRALAARVQRRFESGEARFARGTIGIGEAAPPMPRTGLALNLTARSVEVEQWKSRFVDARPPVPAGKAGASTGLAAYQPVQANIKAEVLDLFGKRLTQVALGVSQDGPNWVATLGSREANGKITFQPGVGRDAGRLGARLTNLIIPAGMARQETGDVSPLDRIVQELPAVDLAIDAFEVGEKKLGRLDLVANNAGGEWRIQRINLANADGVLAGSGVWSARRVDDARRKLAIDFTLEAYDSGKLLDRLGFPGTVRAGNGRLEGNVAWEGSPLAIDYPSLAGNVSLRVEKGQFLKADPGVGKLLGIMSLQALPRRLSLDFRDVFSDGFAFDLVSASSKVERGVMSTTDFKMTGVSAAVLMNGEVDLARETQLLRVVVLPDLSGGMGSVVTALLGNPILGLATYLAQRVFKEPLSKAFSFEYAVSGTWSEPKVARVTNPQVGQTGTNSGDGIEQPRTPPPDNGELQAPARAAERVAK